MTAPTPTISPPATTNLRFDPTPILSVAAPVNTDEERVVLVLVEVAFGVCPDPALEFPLLELVVLSA